MTKRSNWEGKWGTLCSKKGAPATTNSELADFFRDSKNFFTDDRLFQRTVGYKQRDEMASGRQVVAGMYEGLQFPHSKFIGPFLGSVLRFGGDHLGVIKVELHQFDSGKNTSKKRVDNLPEDLLIDKKEMDKQAESFFDEQGLIVFVLSAYALSGILYLLKHHHGLDLMETFRSSLLVQRTQRALAAHRERMETALDRARREAVALEWAVGPRTASRTLKKRGRGTLASGRGEEA
jgi:hypothetical protein